MSETPQEPTEPQDPQDATDPTDAPPSPQVRVRRAPKYFPFGATGVLLGVVVGLVLAFSRPVASDYSNQTVGGYFAAGFGLLGLLVGLGLAVLIERRRH